MILSLKYAILFDKHTLYTNISYVITPLDSIYVLTSQRNYQIISQDHKTIIICAVFTDKQFVVQFYGSRYNVFV